MPNVTLYQFALCPYCHKVRAGLDAKKIPYRAVEVNPMNKRELPPLPEGAPKKVPVLDWDGEILFDSTTILKALDERAPGGVRLLPEDPEALARTEEVETWVDDRLTFALPTVIYGTWGEAFGAAQVTARTSNFGLFQNLMVRAGGSLIMHQVVKRILKKHGEEDGHAWVEREIDQFETWLGEQPFVCGESPSLGDIATHGALTCIADFPAYAELMKRPRLAAWYDRVSALRAVATA
ncbi:MAG: glutathione S-transferase family protein [Polyangia bacterium]